MSDSGKLEAKIDQVKGKVKEAVGHAVGNERLEAEGRAEQAKGDVRTAGEKVKDAVTPDGGKAEARSDQATGKAKETVGHAVGNERLETEGRADQAKGDLREAGEKVKDAFKH